MEKLEKTAAALRRRGFDAAIFETAKEAADYLLSDMPAGETVGFGGCMTAKQMGLETLLRANGHKVLWHWETPKPERPALLREAMNAPLYVCSANAVTEDGLMVQIDGTGNRVGAMCYGPGTVYVLIGRNKIVSGGLCAGGQTHQGNRLPAERAPPASPFPMCRNGALQSRPVRGIHVPRHGGV